MANFARKLARQNKLSTPEGKEEIELKRTEKQASQTQQTFGLENQKAVGNKPQNQVRQRRAGGA